MSARFVRLGIAGFKSFADPTSLEILPGLTGVVGPNGCGKSNVAEALRWAMGEANARHLRGGEMDDVIFAGTATRPSRNLAEVSLSIEGELPPPFAGQAEVQVVRRIDRGAGSGYRVNGREARARDVQTLFADLASGARSSAMVSQGRVGTLVNAKPEERRAVLEEAAGITGLHARRHEAETRLRAAETNLERAAERRALLEKQLDGLRGQAKQAARYRAVTEAAMEAEALLLAVQRGRADQARAEAAVVLQDASEGVVRSVAASTRAAAAAQQAQAALPGLRDAEATARTRVERARLAQEGVAAELARAEAALGAARQRRTHLANDLAHARKALDDAEGADQRLLAEAARLAAEQQAYPAAQDAARTAAEAAAATLHDADQHAAEAASRAAEAAASAGAMRQLLEQAQSRHRRAAEAVARVDAELSRAAAQLVDPTRLQAAADLRDAAERTLTDARAELDQAETLRAGAAPAAVLARDAHLRADGARHKLAAETAALAEVLAVKDDERWKPMVDRLTVPEGLEAALGAVLGEELAAADNPSAARHWRDLPPRAPEPMPGRRLSQVVRGPSLLDRALGGIGLVGCAAEGDAGQSALQPGQCLVSAEGAVWRWDGYTVQAGTPSAAAVRLRQRNRLNALRAALGEAEQAAGAARAARESADAAERDANAAEQRARTARREAEAAAERARTAGQSLRSQADSAGSRHAALQEQLAQLAPELESATAALALAREENAAQPDPLALRSVAEQARAAVAAARASDAGAARALDSLQRAEQARTVRLATIEREREDRRLRQADLASRMTDLSARAAEAETELDGIAGAPARAGAEAERAHAARLAAEAEHRTCMEARSRAEQAAEQAAAGERQAEHAVYTAREALVRAESARDAAALSWDAAQARVAERVEALPPLPVPTELSAAAEDRARNRQHRLTRERDEMGPVNLRADIEAEAIQADITTIETDRDELATAIAKLRGSIGHLNREGRERLSTVFHEVDKHFQTLFGRMFGGGRAHLALVGSDDPLQAGLEIYAQPPGKKLAALTLLSGGEQALTALSLIFAVFRCNPAPLCVLDEVDAPLDDANVERFCTLLADMAQETGTRFLVVTHHQVTMARMDRLYGVTMQERGVSRLLSVDLSRAVDMVEGGSLPQPSAVAAE